MVEVATLQEAVEDCLGRDSTSGPRASAVPSGFDVLDRVLGGGVRPGELTLLGGAPGVGKTIAALQMARHAARQGRQVLYVSYEHDQQTMLGRTLALELAELARTEDAIDRDRLSSLLVEATAGGRSLADLAAAEPLAGKALATLQEYADRLVLARGSGSTTDMDEIAAQAAAVLGPNDLLVLDYLQRVASPDHRTDEDARIAATVEASKDLALQLQLAVLAIVAANWDGLRSGRLRLTDLRGSSALAYECDVALVLNHKHHAVAKAHLAYDTVRAESFHRYVVVSVEKNRSGPAMVDLEFEKDFACYRFHPQGGYLRERLVDDRVAGG